MGELPAFNTSIDKAPEVIPDGEEQAIVEAIE